MCPKCERLGKGKACIHDGTKLVKVSEWKGGGQGFGAPELHLINRSLNVDLVIKDGDIIGRTEGAYTEFFSKFSQVSRRHCQFRLDKAVGWTVVDLGSTNGTVYENVPLTPNQPVPLKNGTFLVIGKKIEFYVEIRSSAPATERV